MSYYEPTLLFRQNAIRRSPYASPTSSSSSLSIPDYSSTSKTSNWLLNHDNNDTEILNKVCCLNRLNIKSNYWKIPDNEMNLTSMTTTTNCDDNAIMAISSGNKQDNLFIYELNLENNYLTHHNTISLPNIYSMKWVPTHENLLMTGNNKGYGHLISTPSLHQEGQDFVSEQEPESAEILKRFNHRKHLRSINKDPSIANHASTIIDKIGFINANKMISIYDNNLFNWDLHDATSSTKPKPVGIKSIKGLKNFDINKYDANLLSIVGNFGISLFDLRDPNYSIPEASKLTTNKNKLTSNIIKWNPENEYIMASSHLDGVIRLWDIRKQENFGTLTGHNGKIINTLDWIDGDLFSGGKDGNIIHWDLTTDLNSENDLTNCGLKEGLNSVNFDPLMNSTQDIINQRQCGTVLPASNSNIIHLETFETMKDLKVLSIDGSSFFGLHSKIYDAINLPSVKDYYSQDDINLMMANENSNVTLVDDEVEETTKPLMISRKPTTIATTVTPTVNDTPTFKQMPITNYNDTNDSDIISEPYHLNNDSNDTLLDSPQLFDSPNSTTTEITDVEVDELYEIKHPIKRLATTLDPSCQRLPQHKYQLSEITFDDFTFDNLVT